MVGHVFEAFEHETDQSDIEAERLDHAFPSLRLQLTDGLAFQLVSPGPVFIDLSG